MALAQTLRNSPIVVEKYVTLPATSGTTVGPAIPAGTLVIAAGFQALQTVPDITTYTMNVTDGTTTFGSALNFDNVAANTIKVGTTPGLISVTDTVDAVTTISGAPGTIYGRIFAVCVNVEASVYPAAVAQRDKLA